MKKPVLLLIALSLFSCGSKEEKKEIQQTAEAATYAEGAAADLTPSEQLGREIFDGKGNCFTCHKPDQKVIGPSVMEIAKMYKEKNGDMVKFLKEEADPIVDPANYSMMKPNFLITKNLTDEELKALEDYFYSHLKK